MEFCLSLSLWLFTYIFTPLPQNRNYEHGKVAITKKEVTSLLKKLIWATFLSNFANLKVSGWITEQSGLKAEGGKTIYDCITTF
jgi:hypothetical protein